MNKKLLCYIKHKWIGSRYKVWHRQGRPEIGYVVRIEARDCQRCGTLARIYSYYVARGQIFLPEYLGKFYNYNEMILSKEARIVDV